MWTQEELEQLKKLVATKTYKEIGEILSRSRSSVIKKCKQLGISLYRGKKWTQEELEYLENHKDDKAYDVAMALGRSVESVNGKRYATPRTSKKKNYIKAKPKQWTKREVAYLKQNIDTKNCREIGKELGRSLESVRSKLGKMGRSKVLWTEEEVAYLVDNFKTMEYGDIAKHIGKSIGSTKAKARSLGIRRPAPILWDDKEVETLKQMVDKHTPEEIASILGRSVNGVKLKISRLGLIKGKWTKEEDEWLEDNYYSHTNKSLAKKIGRSEIAVISRAQKLGLGSRLREGENVSLHCVMKAMYGYYNKRLKEKFVSLGVPRARTPLANWDVYMVKMSMFWDWLKDNQENFNFAKFEANSLGFEPTWVEKKRSKDRLEKANKRWGVA